MALAGIRREYPNHASYLIESDEQLRHPRERTPIFFGCFDWHSAVHTHWTLVQLCRAGISPAIEQRIKSDFTQWITSPNVATEEAWLRAWPGFENPYGLVWLLHLVQSAQMAKQAWLRELGSILAPLASVARSHLLDRFQKLPHPIRHGLHGQTAFGLGLFYDWAVVEGDNELSEELAALAQKFYPRCFNRFLACEPSGYDFLSPTLAEADLLARFLSDEQWQQWWRDGEEVLKLSPLDVDDPANGHAVHYAGLNLSRAWMLRRIGRRLTADQRALIEKLADKHAQHGTSQIDESQFAGSHWLGTFAVYELLMRVS